MAKPKNPLRVWFAEHRVLQRDFTTKLDISQSFLTSLLTERPPWPSRKLMLAIVEATGGAVTADAWMRMPDPPSRAEQDEIAERRRQIRREVEERVAAEKAKPAPKRRRAAVAA